MRKGKILAFVLSLMLVFSTMTMLIGCAPKEDDKYDMWFAAIEGGYGRAHWDSVLNEFERYYEAKHSTKDNPVNITIKKTITHQIEDEISSPLMTNNGPDVVHLATQREKGLTESMYSGTNKLFKLNDLLEEKVYNSSTKLKDVFLPHALGNGVTNPITTAPNDHYMLPIAMGTAGLYFNKTLFDATIAWPEDLTSLALADVFKGGKFALPETMEQFLAIGKVLKDNPVNAKGATVAANAQDRLYLFTYPTGGYFDTMIPSLVASSGGQATLNDFFNYKDGVFETDAVKRVYTDLTTIAGYTHPDTLANANSGEGSSWQNNQFRVMNNTAMFQPNGNWVMGEMSNFNDQKAEGFEWASMPFPGYVNDGQLDRYAKLHMEQIWCPTNGKTEMKPIVKEFILFLYSQAGQAELAKGNGLLVPTKGYLDIVDAWMDPLLVADAESYYTATDLKVAVGAFKNFTSFNLPSGVYGGRLIDAKEYKLNFWCGGIDQILKSGTALYTDATTWLAACETVNDAIRAKLPA